ncbi:carboxylesterase family protein [Arthrobacter sp. Marseille-P9274]|uniref:carboxylesterase family protein n=1 Tax=Arthrobacter sp. Marseille-P9274 TaxID=2866572 RepID=UPI0021C854A1|nr:carboxylesterase family protein [Arthrobacter sp. Marseille-P9274]
MSASTDLAAAPGMGPGTRPIGPPAVGRVPGPRAEAAVVGTLGVHYGERLNPADRFSPVGHPGPGLRQSAPAAFPQLSGSLDWLLGPALMELPQSEDAFQLNIWAPEDASDAPVMIYVPGGAFISGAGTGRWYDGERLAREGGCVVVTVNYRLGALALLGDEDTPRNLAVTDLLQALRWISDNIAGFGGNPDQVTLVGQSAGAWYAYLLSQLPEAEGLFRRVALLSLPWQPPLSAGEYAERHRLFTDALAGQAADQDAPVEALLQAQVAVSKAYAGRGLGLMPAADGTVPVDLFDFAAAARRLHVESLLLNSTQDEAAAFLRALPVAAVGREQLAGFVSAHFEDVSCALAWLDEALPGTTDHAKLVEAMSLHQHRLAAVELAEAVTGEGIPATVARFAAGTPLAEDRSPHCFEVPFVFGDRDKWHDAPMLSDLSEEAFDRAGSELRSLLLGFTADGTPRDAAGAAVGAYDPAAPRLHRIGPDGATTMEPERGLSPRR